MGRLDHAIPRQKNAEFSDHEKKDKEASNLVKQKKVSEAVKLFQENLDWCQKALGKDHAATVYDKETLAFYFNELRRYKEAAELDEQALEARTRIEGLSPPSIDLLDTQRNLANDYLGMKDVKKAADIYEKNYELRKNQLGLGEEDVYTLRVGHDLAACWYRLMEVKKARDLNAKILASRIRLKMPELDIVSSRAALALNHTHLGNLETAETLYRENIRVLKAMTGKNAHPKTLTKNERELEICIQRQAMKRTVPPKMDPPKKDMTKGAQMKTDEKTSQPQAVENKTPRRQSSPGISGSNEKGLKIQTLDKQEDKREVPPKKDYPKKEVTKAPKTAENLPKDNLSTSSSPIPIPKINAPSSNSPGKSSDKAFLDQKKRQSLDLGNRMNNINIPRRAKSQQGRPERKFEFRHLKSSEALSQLDSQSIDGRSDRETIYGPLPGSIPGSWKINPADLNIPSTNRPDDLQPWHGNETFASKSLDSPSALSPPRVASPARSISDSKRVGQLFDAEEGKYDEDSIKPVDSWFKLLAQESQALLDSNRKNQCKRVKIAILDTGIDLKHPDFADDQAKPLAERRIKRPVDFLDPKNSGKDSCGHGTHCVGLLRTVAPWADIYVARVAKDFNGDIDPMVVAKAISRASGTGVDSDGKKRWNVDIISLSLGFYGGSKAVQTAIQDAISNNTLIFAAASNGGTQKDTTFPAWLEGVVCVNCADANGKSSGFNPPMKGLNNYSIIGVNVKSAWIKEDGKETYKRMSGTSVATPIAAGVAALVLEFALQNDPDSFIKDLDFLRHYNGMTEVFNSMSNLIDDYRNIVPWKVLKNRFGRANVKSIIEVAIWQFRGVYEVV